ncbi:hypothetical protein [Paracoccus cavernae]
MEAAAGSIYDIPTMLEAGAVLVAVVMHTFPAIIMTQFFGVPAAFPTMGY